MNRKEKIPSTLNLEMVLADGEGSTFYEISVVNNIDDNGSSNLESCFPLAFVPHVVAGSHASAESMDIPFGVIEVDFGALVGVRRYLLVPQRNRTTHPLGGMVCEKHSLACVERDLPLGG